MVCKCGYPKSYHQNGGMWISAMYANSAVEQIGTAWICEAGGYEEMMSK